MLRSMLGLAALALTVPAAALELRVGNHVVDVDAPPKYERIHAELDAPAGARLAKDVAAGTPLAFAQPALADGEYRWRVAFLGTGERVAPADPATGRDVARVQSLAESRAGRFVVDGGRVVDATAAEPAPKAFFQEDLSVVGSTCVGLDCTSAESFGFDTLRLKENNTKIAFVDTSTSTGIPSNDWALQANDTTSGGLDRFMIVDVSGSRIPFSVRAGAPTNSLAIGATGRIGLRTDAPSNDIHIVSRDSPGIRLEQDGTQFSPYAWDVYGNESAFQVRDVTGGSRLPLRIRPGTPTSTLDIGPAGIAIGATAASAKLDVVANVAPADAPVPVLRVTNANPGFALSDRFTVDSSGNVSARGTISQLSSRTAKENLAAVDADATLAKLAALPIYTWNYRDAASGDRHLGPVAEDFHAQFGLGTDERTIAVGDLAAVALASAQALQKEVAARDARIAELEARIARLERVLNEVAAR